MTSGTRARRTRQPSATKRRSDSNSTAEEIVAVTLKLVRKRGYAGVSMRQIAGELGITATALYYHFKDKNALLDRVSEHILEALPIPDPKLHWSERMKQWLLAQQQSLMEYPGLGRFLLIHRGQARASLHWVEAILEILHGGGITGEDAIRALVQISFLVNPITLIDGLPHASPKLMLRHKQTEKWVEQDPEHYPRTREMLGHLVVDQYAYDKQFLVALDGVITGLQAKMGPRKKLRVDN